MTFEQKIEQRKNLLEMLKTLEKSGIPIPVRFYFEISGLSIEDLK
jgi:hypothetical protein